MSDSVFRNIDYKPPVIGVGIITVQLASEGTPIEVAVKGFSLSVAKIHIESFRGGYGSVIHTDFERYLLPGHSRCSLIPTILEGRPDFPCLLNHKRRRREVVFNKRGILQILHTPNPYIRRFKPDFPVGILSYSDASIISASASSDLRHARTVVVVSGRSTDFEKSISAPWHMTYHMEADYGNSSIRPRCPVAGARCKSRLL